MHSPVIMPIFVAALEKRFFHTSAGKFIHMKIFCTLFFCLFLTVSVHAQKGVVKEIKDPLIDSLILRRTEVSRTDANVHKVIVSSFGYRVQIFYGSDRREVFKQQAKFKNAYPKIGTYITYNAPNYYLRVGDFRTRLEAQKVMNELRPVFSTLFIFREKINAVKLDSTTNDQR